ncbi:transporter substrate-binding domain-containing protein [Nocardia africana]|uniref:Cyclohexadienyl dehydratase n=1 Tax=Nocardia africana TaxID=134964 RepID=A0A378WWV6_9NOCA|nr:transporter substrate-binding domain-containing protein [Nocardia africana]MCC3312885.1 transporter substrate-binding domain-containing protein [Nocardia africana]SUA45776.1 Cyclohexadienyl dehydratase precursor [Nocardia africana]
MALRHRLIAAATAGAAAVLTMIAPARAEDPGAMRVCTTGDYPPYSVSDGHGGYRGIDIDLVRDMAQLLGRQVRFVPTSWASMGGDFAAHACDLAVGGISDAAARRAYADFSLSYGTDGKTPIVRAADAAKYATIEQIDQPQVRVIVNRGGTNEQFARAHFPHAQLTVWPDNVTIFDQITAGRADVFVTDSVEGRYRVRQHPDLRVLHPETPFDSFGKVFLIPKNDVPTALMVNSWLASQLATGGVDRRVAEWIGPHATA